MARKTHSRIYGDPTLYDEVGNPLPSPVAPVINGVSQLDHRPDRPTIRPHWQRVQRVMRSLDKGARPLILDDDPDSADWQSLRSIMESAARALNVEPHDDVTVLGHRAPSDTHATVTSDGRRAERKRNARTGPVKTRRTFRHTDDEADTWQYLVDRARSESEEHPWERVTTATGHSHISDLADLLATMKPIVSVEAEPIRWNGRDYTPQTLAERWARFQWNDDFFDGHRVPALARVGRVSSGSTLERFVYFQDQVIKAACVVKRLIRVPADTPSGAAIVPSYTVFWREAVGHDAKGYRVWRYEASRTFRSRTDAEAFGLDLARRARLEAEAQLDHWHSEGRQIEQGWDRDEFAYDPVTLNLIRSGADDY